jgi:phage terminase large subunit-like protein
VTTLAPERCAAYAAATGVDHFAWWAETYCEQWVDDFAGQPLRIEAFQREFMGEAMAVDDEERSVWRSVVLVLPRKNGKTTLLAAYSVYRLLHDDGAPEILLAASSDRQAGRLFDSVASFVRRSPHLADQVHIRDYIGEIARVDGGGKILRMSSSPERLHGYNPSLVVCDELAQWTTPSLRRAWAALTTGGGARRAAQTFTITTAGEAHDREEGILGRIIDGNEAAGETESPHPGLTISRNLASRTLVYNYSAPTADRHDVAAVKAANPASWVSEDYLRRQAENPELTDAEFLQLHACVWAAATDTYIAVDDWRALGDGGPIAEGREVYLGLDGSRTHDTTVVAWASPAEDGRIDVDARIFSVRRDAPHHVLHEGGRIDYDHVEEFIVERFGAHRVIEAAYDPRYLDRSADILETRLPEAAIFDVQPGSNHYRDALAAFERAVADGRVRHRGDPQIAAHIAACKATQDERGWIVHKRRHSRPIDAVPAMALAVWRASRRAAVQPFLEVW